MSYYTKVPASEIKDFLAEHEEAGRNRFLELGYNPDFYPEYAKAHPNPIVNMLEQEVVIGEFEDSKKIDESAANVLYALNRVAYMAEIVLGGLSDKTYVFAAATLEECKAKYELAVKFMSKNVPAELSGYQSRAQTSLGNLELALGKGGLE